MHIRRLNAALFGLDATHPAKVFLEAFIQCRRNCVGRELDGIDQRWWSTLDQREMQFSSYAYQRISFDVVLDGWLENAPELTQSEQVTFATLPNEVLRMRECRAAAATAGNAAVVELTGQILEMYALWNLALETRKQQMHQQ